ncbi:MAG: hypothetical protein ABIS86_10305 [Streptosporangiaceae bacterium]
MTKKILISSLAGLIVAGLAVAFAVVTLTGKELRYDTQAKLLAAVPTTASAELSTRGLSLAQPLKCLSMPESTKNNMLVSCTGATTAKKEVQVFGAAMNKKKREYYTILVAGKPVVSNAACLGADCKKD